MEVYYINLKKSLYRNKRFLNEGAINFKNLKRFDAVDGSQINLFECLKNYILNYKSYYSIKYEERIHKDDIGTRGALGCYMSHVNLWKLFLKTNLEYCIVLEDDADVKFEDVLKIQDYMKHPPLFDMLLFHRNQAIQDDSKGNVTKFFGTYAYAISKLGAKKFLKNVFPATQQIDAYLSNNIEKRGFIIKNARQIQVGHHLSFGFSDVGHWKIYKNYILWSILFVLVIFLLKTKIY